ncbi:hypothetical protein A2U01_0009551, partial [Trifolium medium]|nr:hypothetical protein [Trifolium medium]
HGAGVGVVVSVQIYKAIRGLEGYEFGALKLTGGNTNAASIRCFKLWMLLQHVLPWNYAVVTGTIQVIGICSTLECW